MSTATKKIEQNDDLYWQEVAEQTNEQIDSLNAYLRADGKVEAVSWKHEGRQGPVYAFAPGAEFPDMMPFGDDCPTCGWPEGMHPRGKSFEGIWYLGWRTRAEARKIAKGTGARFNEA